MWPTPRDLTPLANESKRLLKYWIWQTRLYQKMYNDVKDSFILERTGAYPIWHIGVEKRDGKLKFVLSDSMPVELFNEDIGNNVIRVSSTENPSFKDTINSVKHKVHGFQRQIDIIKGDVDIDGRVNNPKDYSNDPNIRARRNLDKEK